MRNLVSLMLVLVIGVLASGATLEWIGPNGTASSWQTASNWYDLADGSHPVPTNLDTCRLYNALGGYGFTDSNVTVNTTTAICQKLQMKYLTTKLTILTGGKLTTTGSVEMYQGTSGQIDIQAGATMDACTKSNTATATFKLADDGNGGYTETVNVWGTLNVISLVPANGTSLLELCNVSPGSGTGTLNINSTGVVNVDAYTIGSFGTGRINITIGGTMTVKGDATVQVNADIAAVKIAGASGAIASCTYNSGDGKTYITASTGGGPTPPAPPASITYPTSSSTGHYSVTWAASTGATSYTLERSVNGGSWNQVYSGAGTTYSESVTDGDYNYRVKATNSAGTSNWTTGTSNCTVLIPPPASAAFSAGTAAGWDFGLLDSDIVRNNTVDWDDLNVIATHWLNSGCDGTNLWCAGADLDSSTGVDLVDYALLATDWQGQAGKNILLQTIYGTNQDASGTIIYPNTYHALSVGKECLMVFAVPQATALDKGWFKITGLKASYTFRVRLFNVTGQGLLNRTHTIAKASLDSASPLVDITLPTGSSVPSHPEGTQNITDFIVNFGPLEVTAGEYIIAFNNAGGGNTVGSIVRGAGATVADLMGRDGSGGPALPKRATVTTTATVGNTYFYYLSTSSAANYEPVSNLLAFQMTTTIVNHKPVVNAGANQTVQAPGAAVLTGAASDDGNPNPPSLLTTTWSKVSGPGTVVFGDASALNTTATFSDIGTYVLMLTASDSVLTATSQVTIIYTNNNAPVVNAGTDRSVGILDVTNLSGTVTDDGLPNPPAAVTTTWTQESGPGTATFGSPNAVATTVSFSGVGTYVLRLTADDSDLITYDEVTITVLPGSLNDAPVVDAGLDKTIIEPANSVSLDATVTDDGRPAPPGTVTTTWTQESGPGTVTFGDIHAVDTSASFSDYGTYVLRLTASDSAIQAHDELTVTYKPYTYEGYDCNNCTGSALSTCTEKGLTTGGDGGAIVHVTNLTDSGSGSLRAALDGLSGAPTKIVFDVGGTIHLTTGLFLDPTNGNATIAGETAPSPGITLDGSTLTSAATLTVHTHDAIVRHIRIRGNAAGREVIQVMGWYNIIIDHCSVTGGGDGVIDINGGTNQIIISRCIIANGTEAHRSYGNYASLHHNFYYGNNRRQPKIVTQAGPYDWRNNVMEAWTGTGTNIECMTLCAHQVNIVNNYYGPNTNNKAAGNEFHIDPNTYDIYIAGNVVPVGHPDINLKGDRTTPNAEPNFTTLPADLDLVADVKGNCGALPRDSYDASIAGPAAP